MPTGYTAEVQEGTITEFEVFAMRCARNFGALITMRDDRMDAPIPDEFKPSGYHAKAKADAEARLVQLVAMTEAEADKAAMAEFNAAKSEFENLNQKARDQRDRYTAMLNKATAWTPPTTDHQGLKEFMVNQLMTSMDQDCDTSYLSYPTQLTGADWLEQSKTKAQQDVGYHTKALIEEEGRCRTRTEWVRALRQSVGVKSLGTFGTRVAS